MVNQVLSVGQSRELLALGVDMFDAQFHYIIHNGESHLTTADRIAIDAHLVLDDKEIVPTYTLADLLIKLPDSITDEEGWTRILLIVPQESQRVIMSYDKTIQYDGSWLDVAFKMFKWCLKNKKIRQ